MTRTPYLRDRLGDDNGGYGGVGGGKGKHGQGGDLRGNHFCGYDVAAIKLEVLMVVSREGAKE